MVELIAATDEHAVELAPRLSLDALEEIQDLKMTPQFALASSLKYSIVAMSLRLNGKVEGIFGVGRADPMLGQKAGYLWCLPSTAIDEHPLLFARESRRILGVFLESFELMVHILDTKQQRTLRWLKWLGFTAGEPMMHPKRGNVTPLWLASRDFMRLPRLA